VILSRRPSGASVWPPEPEWPADSQAETSSSPGPSFLAGMPAQPAGPAACRNHDGDPTRNLRRRNSHRPISVTGWAPIAVHNCDILTALSSTIFLPPLGANRWSPPRRQSPGTPESAEERTDERTVKRTCRRTWLLNWFPVTERFIKTGTRASSSWPGEASQLKAGPIYADSSLATTLLLQSSGGPYTLDRYCKVNYG
jgi:hypothetical protein